MSSILLMTLVLSGHPGAAALSPSTDPPGDRTLRVSVLDHGSGEPVPMAGVYQVEPDSGVVRAATTNERGLAELRLVGDAPFHLTVVRIGFESVDVTLEVGDLPRDEREPLELRIRPDPVQLPELRAEGRMREAYYGPFRVTPAGMFHDRMGDSCLFAALDGRVIRSVDGMLAFLQRFIDLTDHARGGYRLVAREIGTHGAFGIFQHNSSLGPAAAAAWPCGLVFAWTIPPHERPW